MMKYDFLSPCQIIFGWGRRSELAKFATRLGTRVFLISGSRTLEQRGTIGEMADQLRQVGLSVHLLTAPSHEPQVDDVDSLVDQILQLSPSEQDVVIAIGGGSAIDLAKAAAALVRNRQGSSVVDFLEGVGSGLQITQPPLTVIAVPTTAGTGAEVTKNAVISSYSPAFKKSLRSDMMIPRAVLVDPELTVSIPPDTTAYTGMDAITQLIESYISRKAAPIPQALALSGLKLALPALPVAVSDGSARPEREAMSQAALLSGLALANSGLGMAHGVAAALGVHCRVPHGLACAVMLPATLRFNAAACERQYAELENLFEKNHPGSATAAASFIKRIESLCLEIGIPVQLRSIGVTKDLLPDLVTGSRGNSMSGNPVEISDSQLLTLLEQMW